MKFDTFTTYARIFPAVISAAPLLVLWYFLIREPDWKDLLDFLMSLRFIGTLSVSLVFLYFYAHFIRITSKHFQHKYFDSNRGFPTTYFLLYEDQTYSVDYKDKFRERVRKKLKLHPLDATNERLDPREARNRLTECFDHIRLRVGNGKLVSAHNIWYSFARNLIGGSLYAALFCILNIVLGWRIFHAPALTVISVFLLAIYLGILIFRKPILVQNAEAYARQIIAEFMSVCDSRGQRSSDFQ
jgi:hypothetical protein